MKLSEVKGERVFDIIADIIEPASSILSDRAISLQFDLLRSASDQDGKTKAMLGMVPVLLRKHREDVAAIMGALNGMTAEEYMEGMTIASFTGDVFSLLTDEGLLGFLSASDATQE